MASSAHYEGQTEGPLGFPLTDKQAFALEAILKALPRDSAFDYRKAVIEKSPTEIWPVGNQRLDQTLLSDPKLCPGSETPATGPADQSQARFDVSWISTEEPDRMGEVVAAKGMSDRQFALNPIVTLNHCYDIPPVGKSLWRKVVKGRTNNQEPRTNEGNGIGSWNLDFGSSFGGVKAKTYYPPRPATWNQDKDWPADVAFTLVQADLLRGKSIGFLPVKVHTPTKSELEQWAKRNEDRGSTIEANGDRHALGGTAQSSILNPPSSVPINLVIDEWILLEYACVFLPAQQNAVIESVSKAVAGVSDPSHSAECRLVAGVSDTGYRNSCGGFRTQHSILGRLPPEFQKALGIPLREEPKSKFQEPIRPLEFGSWNLKFPASGHFTRLSEIEKAIQRRIQDVDLQRLVESRLDLLRGRI